MNDDDAQRDKFHSFDGLNSLFLLYGYIYLKSANVKNIYGTSLLGVVVRSWGTADHAFTKNGGATMPKL